MRHIFRVASFTHINSKLFTCKTVTDQSGRVQTQRPTELPRTAPVTDEPVLDRTGPSLADRGVKDTTSHQ
ncbi:hypothetical protein EYF80_015367 [Liparis tanakae]|uniref:Uncharacterized protein n=1 Tax=Liparis tanakae TaxID=230148 RepID=A0A4Z2I8X5_9TELE|nr:hypothetical protein EYF80_015367 [Liparis tanakae]